MESNNRGSEIRKKRSRSYSDRSIRSGQLLDNFYRYIAEDAFRRCISFLTYLPSLTEGDKKEFFESLQTSYENSWSLHMFKQEYHQPYVHIDLTNVDDDLSCAERVTDMLSFPVTEMMVTIEVRNGDEECSEGRMAEITHRFLKLCSKCNIIRIDYDDDMILSLLSEDVDGKELNIYTLHLVYDRRLDVEDRNVWDSLHKKLPTLWRIIGDSSYVRDGKTVREVIQYDYSDWIRTSYERKLEEWKKLNGEKVDENVFKSEIKCPANCGNECECGPNCSVTYDHSSSSDDDLTYTRL